MLVKRITTSGNSAALLLSQDLLGLLGLAVGDEVVLELAGESLVVRLHRRPRRAKHARRSAKPRTPRSARRRGTKRRPARASRA
jgi:antitoxin component of MazEF toxin-antitoxin module